VEAAHELFLEHGFDAVSVREIADRADVPPTTVFAHFPQKEALAFGDEDERHERLVAALSGRPPGTSISAALRAHYLAEITAFGSEPQRQLLALMEQTLALVEYAERMWFRRLSCANVVEAQDDLHAGIQPKTAPLRAAADRCWPAGL
jgi:AcrR family transcriptional regulator